MPTKAANQLQAAMGRDALSPRQAWVGGRRLLLPEAGQRSQQRGLIRVVHQQQIGGPDGLGDHSREQHAQAQQQLLELPGTPPQSQQAHGDQQRHDEEGNEDAKCQLSWISRLSPASIKRSGDVRRCSGGSWPGDTGRRTALGGGAVAGNHPCNPPQDRSRVCRCTGAGSTFAGGGAPWTAS